VHNFTWVNNNDVILLVEPKAFLALRPVAMCSQVWLHVLMNTPTVIEVHGPAIREIRLRSGMSVLQLADSVGVKRPYIAKIELGHSRRVSPQVFNAFIAALSIQDRRAILANPYGAAS